MQKLSILNSREVKRLRSRLQQDFGHFPDADYAFLQNEKGKIFITTKSLALLGSSLRIDKVGLYFAEARGEGFRLSKEGAQLLALDARKKNKPLQNMVSLAKEEVKTYFTGEDLEKDLGGENRQVLLEHAGDILGCAQYKERKILNFLPKIHRGEVIL